MFDPLFTRVPIVALGIPAFDRSTKGQRCLFQAVYGCVNQWSGYVSRLDVIPVALWAVSLAKMMQLCWLGYVLPATIVLISMSTYSIVIMPNNLKSRHMDQVKLIYNPCLILGPLVCLDVCLLDHRQTGGWTDERHKSFLVMSLYNTI